MNSLSTLVVVWLNWFHEGTGFWKCNFIFEVDIHNHIYWSEDWWKIVICVALEYYCFGKVLENVVLFLSVSMVLPWWFYIERFLRRQIVQNCFYGTSHIAIGDMVCSS